MAGGSCSDWSNLKHTGRVYIFRRYWSAPEKMATYFISLFCPTYFRIDVDNCSGFMKAKGLNCYQLCLQNLRMPLNRPNSNGCRKSVLTRWQLSFNFLQPVTCDSVWNRTHITANLHRIIPVIPTKIYVFCSVSNWKLENCLWKKCMAFFHLHETSK